MKKVLIFSYIESTIELIDIVKKYAEVAGVVIPINRKDQVDSAVFDYLSKNNMKAYIQPRWKCLGYNWQWYSCLG